MNKHDLHNFFMVDDQENYIPVLVGENDIVYVDRLIFEYELYKSMPSEIIVNEMQGIEWALDELAYEAECEI